MTFTIDQIRNYLKSQDSFEDALYNLKEENILKANPVKYTGENYSKPLPKWCTVYTLKDFQEAVEDGSFTDYDGFGRFVKDDLQDMDRDAINDDPISATHVAWYNK